MAVNKPRNRILIFRLTQDEYSALQAASSSQGARSLSEFARERLLGSLGRSPIDEQLSDLRLSVARLTRLLDKESA
jgi:hypothetical protein